MLIFKKIRKYRRKNQSQFQMCQITHTNFSGGLILNKKHLLIFQQYFKLIQFKYVYELGSPLSSPDPNS